MNIIGLDVHSGREISANLVTVIGDRYDLVELGGEC